MINDLFINMLLLVAFTFVAGHILKEISEKNINFKLKSQYVIDAVKTS